MVGEIDVFNAEQEQSPSDPAVSMRPYENFVSNEVGGRLGMQLGTKKTSACKEEQKNNLKQKGILYRRVPLERQKRQGELM